MVFRRWGLTCDDARRESEARLVPTPRRATVPRPLDGTTQAREHGAHVAREEVLRVSGRSTTQVWRIIQEWMDGQLVEVTQSKVAAAIGVQRSALSQWKLGQARPTPANLRRIQEVTRVPYRQLLDALLVDMGYLSIEELMEHDRSAPITQAGDAGTEERNTPTGVVARTPGHKSAKSDNGSVKKRRARQG